MGGPPATLRVAPDEARAQAGTSTHVSGGSSPVPFRWPIVMQMSPPVLQGRRGWVSRLPRPRSPPGPRTRASSAKLPGLPGNAMPSTGSLGLWSTRDLPWVPALGACSVCPRGLSPGSFTRLGPALRPRVATSSQPGPPPSALPVPRASCPRPRVPGGSPVGGAALASPCEGPAALPTP